jgi:hypothetical protein
MESNGPNVKLRGTVSQLWDKYQTLARDAIASGNRVSAENYLQHAEHYLRVMNGTPRPNAQQNPQQNAQQNAQQNPRPRAQAPETEAPQGEGETLAAPVEPESKPEKASATAEGGEPEPPLN